MQPEQKALYKRLRHEFGVSAIVLLVYYAIMNAAVALVDIVDAVAYTLISIMTRPSYSVDALVNELVDRLLGNGWGYALAVAIGLLLLLVWKKPRAFRAYTRVEKPMTVRAFSGLFSLVIAAQLVFTVLYVVVEFFLNLVGLSAESSAQAASGGADTFSMFLYAGLLAPISEEILYRGLILRSLEPYGRKFAVFASAFLFGLFHGNIVQSPYAFVVGLVLGYTAIEYSIGWAMLLHMFNNLILGDTLPRLLSPLPELVQEAAIYGIIVVCALVGLVYLAVERHAVADYFTKKRIHPVCLKCFFTSPAVIALGIIMVFNMLMVLFL